VDVMDASIQHAKHLARELHHCSKRCVVQVALKELGMPSSHEGFPLAKITVLILCENRFCKLDNGAYSSAGALAEPSMDSDQVCRAISRSIQKAWAQRNHKIWRCYFPEGTPGCDQCPSNRDFLFGIVDFVELWQDLCEEVDYAKQ